MTNGEQSATICSTKELGLDGEKLIKRWLSSKPVEANRKEAEAVLSALGCEIRNGGENHLIGFHSKLVGDPRFRNGMVTINCHYKQAGAVHPAGIEDLIRVAKALRGRKK